MTTYPRHWVTVPLFDALRPDQKGRVLHQGWSPQCESYPSPSEAEWGVLKTTAIQPGEFQSVHNKCLPHALEARPELEVHDGDLLLTCAGPRVRCGVPCLVRGTRPKLMISGKMYRMRSREGVVEPGFLEAFFLAPDTQAAIDAMKTGSSESGMNLTHERFSRLVLPLPPINEQRRIVVKLDSLMARSRRAKDALDAIPAMLERFRQSVLAAAFRGDLTRDWREANQDVEPASQLLERIRSERRRRWEDTELERMRGKGKAPKDARWKEKYEEPAFVDPTLMDQLPSRWAWAHVDLVADVGTGATPLKSSRHYYEGGEIPWVTSGALNEPFVSGCDEKVTEAALRETNLTFFPRGTLLVAMYGEGRTRGKCSELTFDATTNQAIAALVLRPCSAPLRSWLKMFLTKNYEDIRFGASGGVQPNLNLGIIKRLVFPVPPLEELALIIGLVEERMRRAGVVTASLHPARKRLDQMEPAILAKAFSGELVPQNSSDEPASELLVRFGLARESGRLQEDREKRRRPRVA